jgi:flagellar basal body-associated protein FliL
MPDDQSEKIVRLLEEIRDLTQHRNEKLDKMLEAQTQRYQEAVDRQEKAQARALAVRRRFLMVLIPLLVLSLGWFTYVFWMGSRSDRELIEKEMEHERMMQSNYLAQPH